MDVLRAQRTRIPILTLTVILIASILVSIAPALAQSPLPSPVPGSTYNPDDLLAIKPSLRDDIAVALPIGMPVYDIAVALSADNTRPRTLEGRLAVDYTNTTGESLEELPFRLYANSAAENHDVVMIESAVVNNVVSNVNLTVDKSIATLPLPEPLAPGDGARIEITFTTNVPTDESLHYGILNFASDTETWSLAHWYPVIAGRDPVTGWMLEPTSEYGDPIFTDAGLYTVSVTAPEELTLITSGVEVNSTVNGDGMATTVFNAAPSRDFVMFADAGMDVTTREVAGTTISSWYQPANHEAGETVTVWGQQSLTLFNDLLGEYPYRELQLAEIDIYNAAGVEFPQLIAISSDYYERPIHASSPGYFAFTVAHEVVHQWFYNIVGNNQYKYAFIDEGLTNFLSSKVYFSEFWNEMVGEQMYNRHILSPYEKAVGSSVDPLIDTPTDDFATQGEYVTAVYSKAAVGFAAIHEEIGDDAFFNALQEYVQDFQFRVATPDDLLSAFQGASDVDVEAIWVRWFERQEGEADIAA